MTTTQQRMHDLREIIKDAEKELRTLEWATQTQGHNSGWFQQPQKVCCMPQGHPSHCGCYW